MFYGKNTVLESVTEAKRSNESDRQAYYKKITEIYNGNASSQFDKNADAQYSAHADLLKQFKRAKLPMGFLRDLIDKLSRVYKHSASRSFYLEGKKVVSEVPEGMNANDYVVDEALVARLNKVYSPEMQMAIEKAECMANLYNTVVYVVDKPAQDVTLNIISPEDCAVVEDPTDNTRMIEIAYRTGVVNQNNGVSTVNVDRWGVPSEINQLNTPTRKKTEGNKETIIENQYAIQHVLNVKASNPDEDFDGRLDNAWHIGSGFAPFVVFRSEPSCDDFWNVQNQDLVQCIEQLHNSLARFIIQLGTTSHPLIVAKNVGDGTAISTVPGSINHIGNSQNNLFGASVAGGPDVNQASLETIDTKSQIEPVLDAIIKLVQVMYSLHGINRNDLVLSGQKQSVESKAFDSHELKAKIEKQRNQWALNEKHLFEVIKLVYNKNVKDTVNSIIPTELELKVNFTEAKDQDQLTTEFANDMIKLEHNLITCVDMMIKESGNDLTYSEASQKIAENKVMNESIRSGLDELPEFD